MRKHTGMRPQDIAILSKVFIWHDQPWFIKDLAYEMHISQSECSESLHRSWYAGLLDDQKLKLLTVSFYEFLIYGLRYVFPQRPAEMMRGVPTAHSHPDLKKIFVFDDMYVWPDEEGKEIGFGIEPFYSRQTKAVMQDTELYLMLSLIEILRVGKVREINLARKKLKEILLLES